MKGCLNPSYPSQPFIPTVKAILNGFARSVTKMTEACHRETERLSPLDRAHTDTEAHVKHSFSPRKAML